jgi:hypothetical protein
MPAATGNSAATVITPVLLNPVKSASAGANFKVMAVVKVPMKTSQAGKRSQARNANIITRMPTISQASTDMVSPYRHKPEKLLYVSVVGFLFYHDTWY